MKKEDLISLLERKFRSIERNKESQHYFQFYQDYVLFLGSEREYIPKVVDYLVDSGVMEIGVVIIFAGVYHIMRHAKGNEGTENILDTPAFVTPHLVEKYDFNNKALDFFEKEQKKNTSTVLNAMASPSKEDLIFPLDRIHNSIMDVLQIGGTRNIKYVKNTLIIDGHELLTFSSNTNEHILLNTVFELILARKLQMDLDSKVFFDEIAESRNTEYNKAFSRSMYQAARRIEAKLKATRSPIFFTYNTKEIVVILP